MYRLPFFLLMMRKIVGNLVLTTLPILLVVLYYKYYATSGDVWSVQCTFHDITGWQCPGCGGQRAFHYLLHGKPLFALRHNVLIVIILPILLFCYFIIGQIYLVGNKKYTKYLDLKPWYAYVFLIALLLFFFLRNIPLFPFTMLSPP